ncbi:MAG: ATP-grasp domain-containing protein, partial [Desulfovibrio sp.]|nr:ATP-grasp domain-containing protein [Desulfovibrio sp.]
PYIYEDDFVAAINKVAAENEIEMIFSTHDSVLLELVKRRGDIRALALGCDLFTAELCRYKDKLYKFFEGEDFIPRWTQDPEKMRDETRIVKPIDGQGAVGCERVEAGETISVRAGTMISQFLSGPEYTIDCFTDRKGKLAFCGGRTRDIIKMGITFRSRPHHSAKIERIGEILNERLGFRGLWFFQVKEDNEGNPKLLEISSRVATTMGLCRQRGVNLPLMTAYDALDMDISVIKQAFPIELETFLERRYRTDLEYKTLYVDYDDTLTVHDRVNANLIKFLYQAADRGKELILLTRHEGDIYQELERRKICAGLFARIIHLAPDADKLPYISGNAIYIDNMFHDRKVVAEKIGARVFDVDAIECLMDY